MKVIIVPHELLRNKIFIEEKVKSYYPKFRKIREKLFLFLKF